MIKLTKKDRNFKSVYWLTEITKKNDQRDHIKTIKVESGVAVKTDGHRLHAVVVNVPDGYYEINKRTKSEIVLNEVDEVTWPDWEHIFSDCRPDLPTFSFYCGDDPGQETAKFFIDLAKATENTPFINGTFVSQTITGFLNNEVFVTATDSNHPVFIYDENYDRVAAIMPFLR